MNRCPKSPVTPFLIAACALLVGASMVFHQEARAERGFPLKTERAEMKFVELPDVLLNGKPERLAHAVRVRDERNAIVMPGTVNGRSAVVNYLRDARGQVREVWILSPQEAAIPLKPVPTTLRPAPSADATASYAN